MYFLTTPDVIGLCTQRACKIQNSKMEWLIRQFLSAWRRIIFLGESFDPNTTSIQLCFLMDLKTFVLPFLECQQNESEILSGLAC